MFKYLKDERKIQNLAASQLSIQNLAASQLSVQKDKEAVLLTKKAANRNKNRYVSLFWGPKNVFWSYMTAAYLD